MSCADSLPSTSCCRITHPIACGISATCHFTFRAKRATTRFGCFFMISGFVIFFTIERSKTWVDFAVSRTTRLYPVYWITLTIVFVVEGLWSKTHGFWLGGYVANMTMLQEYLGYENHDVVYWSLTIEVAFYVIMAIIFRAGLTQRIGTVALAWLSMSWIAVWVARGIGLSMPTILTRYLIVQYPSSCWASCFT